MTGPHSATAPGSNSSSYHAAGSSTASGLPRRPPPVPYPCSPTGQERRVTDPGRVDVITKSAYATGHQDGERHGYSAGWWFGFICGALLTAVAGLVVVQALRYAQAWGWL